MSRIPLVPSDSAEVGTPVVLDTGARIAAAAFELFAAQGYDGTTVDAIAERAGIARRTFFRYFRSKDDVIFPDHDSLLATVSEHLTTQSGLSPVTAICSVVRLVLLSYVAEPQVSVQRYRLTRSVAALRERELASVQRYERTFSKYVRERLVGLFPDSEAVLRADVIAATVVAAHNAVLREWLREGASYDPMGDLDKAFTWVIDTFEPSAPPRPDNDGDSDIVVAVFRADQPLSAVVERISRSL